MPLRLAVATALAIGCLASSGAAQVGGPGPTGQKELSTPILGALRDDLLAASADVRRRNRPDPAHPLLVRSALNVDGARPAVRALIVTFRSLTGRRCAGVAFDGRAVTPTRLECLPPCSLALCPEIYSGGPLPRGARILIGTAQPRVTEIRLTGSAGRVRRYRVSRTRVGVPRLAPILVSAGDARVVRAFAGDKQVAWLRFRG